MEKNYFKMPEIKRNCLEKSIDKINVFIMKAFIGSTSPNFPLEAAVFSMMDSCHFKTPLETIIIGSALAYVSIKNSYF